MKNFGTGRPILELPGFIPPPSESLTLHIYGCYNNTLTFTQIQTSKYNHKQYLEIRILLINPD